MITYKRDGDIIIKTTVITEEIPVSDIELEKVNIENALIFNSNAASERLEVHTEIDKLALDESIKNELKAKTTYSDAFIDTGRLKELEELLKLSDQEEKTKEDLLK